MHDITAQVSVTDLCDPNPSFQLIKVHSSELADTKGNGNTIPDIIETEYGTADTTFKVRAERSGGGPGRTYTVTYNANDASGNSRSVSAVVRVEKLKGETSQNSTPKK